MDTPSTLKQTLKKNGYSITKARMLVFELLEHSEPHTMPALLIRAGNTVDRASIYRTIELFEKLGIVQRLYIGWKYTLELTDAFSSHHHHSSCLSCGLVVVLDEHDQIESLLRSVSLRAGITAVHHQLEIQGYCTNCAPSYSF